MNEPYQAYEEGNPDTNRSSNFEIASNYDTLLTDGPIKLSAPLKGHSSKSNIIHSMLLVSALSMVGRFFRGILSNLFIICEREIYLNFLGNTVCIASRTPREMIGAIYPEILANIFGCFFLGLFQSGSQLTSSRNSIKNADQYLIVWLKPWHFLQRWYLFVEALQVGLFGSLTSFAALNMYAISSGYGGEREDTAWPSAFLTYFMGLQSSVIAFVLGQHVAIYLNHVVNSQDYYHDSSSKEEEGEEGAARSEIDAIDHNNIEDDKMLSHSNKRKLLSTVCNILESRPSRFLASTVLLVILLVFFLFAARSNNDNNEDQGPEEQVVLSRTLWLAVLLSPVGALLRWVMMAFNGQARIMSLYWVPIGTFIANIIGSLVDIILVSSVGRDAEPGGAEEEQGGTGIGFVWCLGISLGTLSTMSLFIQEFITLIAYFPTYGWAYWYLSFTAGSTFALGLIIYGWFGQQNDAA